MAARYDLDNRGGPSKYQYLHRCIRSDEEVKHLAAEQGISLQIIALILVWKAPIASW